MSEFLNPYNQLESVKEVFRNTNLTAADFDLKGLFAGLDWDAKVSGLRHWAVNERGVAAKAFDRAHHVWRVTQRIGGYPADVVEFVDLFCTQHTVTIGFDGRLSAAALGREPDAASLATDIYLIGQRLHLPPAMRSKEAIGEALARFTRHQRDTQISAAQALVVTDNAPPADAEWLKLAQAFADPSKQSHTYTVRVLQAAIWQVKRKLLNAPEYPVTDHLMAILTGPQGSGKSTLWAKFFEPLRDFVYPTDFDKLKDSKNHDLWRHPIVFFDEMAYAGRADMDEVKNAITSQTRTSRLHHSHSSANIRNGCTFFGATNSTLGSIMYDRTGLRRFAPISTLHAPHNRAAGVDVVDWAAINEIDFLCLWRSVDHRAGHPLQNDPAAKGEWLDLIEAERAIDSVESFVRDFEPSQRAYRYSEFFDLYTSYCNACGERPLARRNFERRVSELSDAPTFPFRRGKSKGYPTWTPIAPTGDDVGADNVIDITTSTRPDLAAFLASHARSSG